MSSRITQGSSPIDASFAAKMVTSDKGRFFVGDEWFEVVFPEAVHQGIQIARLTLGPHYAWLPAWPSSDGDGLLFGMPITREIGNGIRFKSDSNSGNT